jgi:geranylgeranyl diphosphate synthase, type II
VSPAAPDGAPSLERLEAFLSRERSRVDEALARIAAEVRAEAPGALAEPMFYALTTTGKRLRPILCATAYRAISGAEEVPAALYRLSCALEIVHTYSLVHDDLPCMDDDDLRRGRPTVHRVYGSPFAVVAGASLLSLAVEVLLKESEEVGLAPAAAARLVAELCAAAGAEGMVGGQYLDLLGEHSAADAAALEAIHRGKTGALLAASLRIGALAAHASDEQLQALTEYGRALGLAFQIVDDVLDVVGETQALGKTAGRDQALRKASYPSLFGIEGARSLARARADEAKNALADLTRWELLALADFVVERSN